MGEDTTLEKVEEENCVEKEEGSTGSDARQLGTFFIVGGIVLGFVAASVASGGSYDISRGFVGIALAILAGFSLLSGTLFLIYGNMQSGLIKS